MHWIGPLLSLIQVPPFLQGDAVQFDIYWQLGPVYADKHSQYGIFDLIKQRPPFKHWLLLQVAY
jgi:hypothetical protein